MQPSPKRMLLVQKLKPGLDLKGYVTIETGLNSPEIRHSGLI